MHKHGDRMPLVPEEAYSRAFVEQFRRDVGRETRAMWRPVCAIEADLEDTRQRCG